jgi:hypothetical protein
MLNQDSTATDTFTVGKKRLYYMDLRKKGYVHKGSVKLFSTGLVVNLYIKLSG